MRNSRFKPAADLLQRYRKEIVIMEMTQNPKIRSILLNLLNKSNSQTGQDLMALLLSNFKSEGYFVEIGATDGVGISNTLILAVEYQWKGILCEPGSFWKKDLIKNRWGRIVSRSKFETAKKEQRLKKYGYTAKKGKFGAVKIKGFRRTKDRKK